MLAAYENREPDYTAEMRLPEGRACADCAHVKRCVGFGFSRPESTSCDFWPSRFRTPTPLPPATPEAA